MINSNTLHNLLKGFNLISKSRDSIPLKAGTIMEAKVVSLSEEGNPILRLMLPGSGKEKLFEAHKRKFGRAREKRKELENDIDLAKKILKDGAEKASAVAIKTIGIAWFPGKKCLNGRIPFPRKIVPETCKTVCP